MKDGVQTGGLRNIKGKGSFAILLLLLPQDGKDFTLASCTQISQLQLSNMLQGAVWMLLQKNRLHA